MKAMLLDRYNHHPWHSDHPRVTNVGDVLDAVREIVQPG
jgi:hypothetical protein